MACDTPSKSGQMCFFVDDELKVCQAVAKVLERIGLKVHYFTRADNCFEQLHCLPCDLLVTDLRMPEMSGMELLTKVRRTMPSLPVVILTGYGDIPTAVRAVKAGAYDFIEKPFSKETLVSAIKRVLGQTIPSKAIKRKSLTRAEITILRLILQGRGNRETAYLRSCSERTIEWHRANIMRKLSVNNVVDLVKQAISLGFGAEMPQHK